MDRPSFRELDRKLSQAKESVSRNKILTINPAALAEDAFDLGFLISDLADTLYEILIEIKPQNYVGRRPPEKSYEDEIQNLDLFAFRWDSARFGCEVYFKFVINGDFLYIVSLHQHRPQKRGVNKMDTQNISCPRGHSDLEAQKAVKETTFRGEHIEYEIDVYVCRECGIEIGTLDQAAKAQLAIAEAYKKRAGLLTSADIKENRKRLGWSQKKLAQMTGLGISSIKRWELGIIQTKPMDSLLRRAFDGHKTGNYYIGNRMLSLERVNLVMMEFEKHLGFSFLQDGDMLLYDAKYIWFADMVAHRELGRSMTGATYAALPHGPQLNNYRDLVDDIRNADRSKAKPLSEEELKIIARVARKFPTKKSVFEAAHREPAWKTKSTGAIILYSDSANLVEI